MSVRTVKPGSSNDILGSLFDTNSEEESIDAPESVTSSDKSPEYFSPPVDDPGEDDSSYNIDPEDVVTPNEPPHDEAPIGVPNHSPSPSPPVKQPSTGRPVRNKQTVTKCRFVPVVYSGNAIVKLGEICFQVPASAESSIGS
jgi:hypothetical protein